MMVASARRLMAVCGRLFSQQPTPRRHLGYFMQIGPALRVPGYPTEPYLGQQDTPCKGGETRSQTRTRGPTEPPFHPGWLTAVICSGLPEYRAPEQALLDRVRLRISPPTSTRIGSVTGYATRGLSGVSGILEPKGAYEVLRRGERMGSFSKFCRISDSGIPSDSSSRRTAPRSSGSVEGAYRWVRVVRVVEVSTTSRGGTA